MVSANRSDPEYKTKSSLGFRLYYLENGVSPFLSEFGMPQKKPCVLIVNQDKNLYTQEDYILKVKFLRCAFLYGTFYKLNPSK